MTPRLDRLAFRALGTTCNLAAVASAIDTVWARACLLAGRTEIEACGRVLTRFDPRSDLSRLNTNAGSWIEVDERLLSALHQAVLLRDATGGRFDPTILPALTAAGYRRSFELLEPGLPAWHLDGWAAGGTIDVDPSAFRARVEKGAAVDLGAMGKGFAATRALEAMGRVWGALRGALVDLGGDVAVRGEPPEGGAWQIAVADPRRPTRQLGTIRLVRGGVATSGPSERRFGPGNTLHHLIDPGSGEPAADGPLAVTVVAPEAVAADAHATALAVSPVDDAAAYVGSHDGLGAVVVDVGDELQIFGHVDFVPFHVPAEVRS